MPVDREAMVQQMAPWLERLDATLANVDTTPGAKRLMLAAAADVVDEAERRFTAIVERAEQDLHAAAIAVRADAEGKLERVMGEVMADAERRLSVAAGGATPDP